MKKLDILIIILIVIIIFLSYKVIKNNQTIEVVDVPQQISPEPIEDKGKMIYQDIYLKYENNKDTINTVNDNDVVFTLKGENTTNESIYYEIKLKYDGNNSNINNKLNIKLMELDENNNVKNNIDINRFNTINDRIIFIEEIKGLESIDKKYKLQIYSDIDNEYNNILVDVSISLEKKSIKRKREKSSFKKYRK